MLLILSGTTRSDAVPWPEGNGARGPPERSPTLIGASAFLTRSARRETLRVAPERDPEGDLRTCVVYSVGAAELDRLRERAPEAYVATLLAASCSLSHLLRRFISLGLNRVWLSAGEAAYVQGEEATSMFVLISGRVRLLRRDRDDDRGGDGSKGVPRASERRARSRRDHRRGTSARGGRYPSTAMCLRDSELVRMSRGALTLVCARNPTAASRLLEAMARKLHATLKRYARATGSRDRRVGSRARRGRVRGGDARGGTFDARSKCSARRCGSTNRPRGTRARRHRRASGGEILPVETHGVDGAAGGKSPVHRPAGGRARVAVVAGVRVAGG